MVRIVFIVPYGTKLNIQTRSSHFEVIEHLWNLVFCGEFLFLDFRILAEIVPFRGRFLF